MKLKITFIAIPPVDEIISISITSSSVEFASANVFKVLRSSPGEVTIGANVNVQAFNYYTAFIADWGSNYNVLVVENVVTIEAVNSSDIYNYFTTGSLEFVTFEEIETLSNNAIHEIIFTPKQYAYPAIMQRDYLITEDDYLVVTEDNKKIRL